VALIQSETGVGDAGARHFAFRVDRANFEKAREELARREIAFTFDDHEVSWGIYFQDPDGHTIELACYEV
jgi:catechol-2,3-dioxygenase